MGRGTRPGAVAQTLFSQNRVSNRPPLVEGLGNYVSTPSLRCSRSCTIKIVCLYTHTNNQSISQCVHGTGHTSGPETRPRKAGATAVGRCPLCRRRTSCPQAAACSAIHSAEGAVGAVGEVGAVGAVDAVGGSADCTITFN